MDYAIEVLKKDKKLIDTCLSKWDKENYPDIRKRQEKKSNELERAADRDWET